MAFEEPELDRDTELEAEPVAVALATDRVLDTDPLLLPEMEDD